MPCGHLPPLIPADSTVPQSLIDKLGLHSGRRRRRSSPTDIATGIGCSCSSSNSCLGETGASSSDGQDLPKCDHLCPLVWHTQHKQDDDMLGVSPEVHHCYQSHHNTTSTTTTTTTTTNNLVVSKEKISDDRCWLAEENSLSQPENLLPSRTGSGGETPSSIQSVSNSCCSSTSSGTNGMSSADLSPLTGSGVEAENDGCGSLDGDNQEHQPSSNALFVCSPQNCPANLISVSFASTNKRKNEKTQVNNLQVARPKEQSRDLTSCNTSHHHHHQHCHQWPPNPHRHTYVQDYGRPHQVNIPVESHCSMLDDSNQNSLLSIQSRNNALSVSSKQPSRCSLNENAITCPPLKSTSVTAATDPQPLAPAPLPTTTMPYSNCVPFKQGLLVHGNGPLNGNMVCTPKCCMACTPNGLVMTSDFKSVDINKMPQQANSQHLNNQKKHSSVAELVNYKNGHDAASGSTSNTKTVLLMQSNLNSSQPPPQNHYHTCKSLKCEKLATSAQTNNSTLISSQIPAGTSPTACVNCSTSVKSINNANVGPSGSSGTNGKLVSKKCKALHNLQCKFQKNRFISSFQDCCRACNSYDGCRGSTESLELEAGLLCPSYSYCDSDNVTSMHKNKDNHNYKNQLVSLVSESPSSAMALPLSKSNNNCSSVATNKNLPSNLQSNDFSSSSTGHVGGGLVARVDIREDDFGDFIEADFPPVPNSGCPMSSSTDSTESYSSLASSDIPDGSSPNQQPAVSPMNNIATLVSDQTATPGVSSLCSTFFKNCDYKKNNQISTPAPTFQAVAAAYPSPMVTGANPSLKKCSKKTLPNPHSPLPATCLPELGDGNNVKREQASSVIKYSDVSKMSSSFLSSSSLSLQSPVSSPSSSSSSPSSVSFPTCSFLCSGDRHSHAKHKADKNTSSGSGSRHTTDTSTNRSSNSCHNNVPSPLPLAGISAACAQTGPNSTSQPPSATFLLSPEVDFLDFDLVTPNMDSEQNVNSAGSSNGTTGFDFSLYEIPYADDVDSACPSPVEDLSPNMVIGAAGGGGGGESSASHPVLTNCATNDLSASSSNSNLSGRSTLEDAMLPPGHSNLETVRARVQNAFSNLYLDYRDDISVDSEETGSHDSNEISEGDDQHPSHHHHRRHHCGLTHTAPNGSLNNNLLISPDSVASSQDIDLRDNPGVSEPIYEDIDGVHLDKCTADSPGDKCCCVSPDSLHKTDVQVLNMQHSKKPPSKSCHSSIERVMIWDENQVYRMQVKQTESDVSACGPIAVLNVLNAFEFPVEKSKVLEKAPVNLRDTSAPVAPYLFSRAKAGTTAEVLIKCVESVTNGAIRGRFFDFHPQRDVHLLKWLGEWMKKDAVPLATLNIQKSVRPGWVIPDSWHHQMIYGVSSKGVYLTNPLKVVSEDSLMQQLTSDSVLLIRRFDIISRFNEDTNLSQLMTHKNSNKWRTMNVLGQVVNVLREASMPRFSGYRPQLTQHIRIPAAYRSGITLFIRQEAAAFHELMNAPDLPLKVDLSQEVALHMEKDGATKDKEDASGSCWASHPDHQDHCGEHCSGQYKSYEYGDSNYYGSSSARISPSVSFGPGTPNLDMGVAAGAAAAGSSNSSGSLHPHLDLPDYAGGARYFVNHGYPRQNNVYIHYFNS